MKKLITILATLATTATLSAKVTLPEIIGDNMALGQGSTQINGDNHPVMEQ